MAILMHSDFKNSSSKVLIIEITLPSAGEITRLFPVGVFLSGSRKKLIVKMSIKTPIMIKEYLKYGFVKNIAIAISRNDKIAIYPKVVYPYFVIISYKYINFLKGYKKERKAILYVFEILTKASYILLTRWNYDKNFISKTL
jgi:hypothetical protein